jgi:hypothetical protein
VWAAERGSVGAESSSGSSGGGFPAYAWFTNPATVPSADVISAWLPALWALLAFTALGWPAWAGCASAAREAAANAWCRAYGPEDLDSEGEGEEEGEEEGELLAADLRAVCGGGAATQSDGPANESAGPGPFVVPGRWISV